MTKNPFINALAAEGYIWAIVGLITYMGKYGPQEDPFTAPILALSLLVFSAALMGYIFLFKPLTMYLDGQREEGVKLFLKTLGIFAIFSLIVFGLVLFAI